MDLPNCGLSCIYYWEKSTCARRLAVHTYDAQGTSVLGSFPLSPARRSGSHLHWGEAGALEVFSQTHGQLSLLIWIRIPSYMWFAGLSDFPWHNGGPAEYRTEVWGQACIRCQPHALLARWHWHVNIQFICADLALVTVFWCLVQSWFSLMT